jgi:hypothetical protein
MGSLPAGSHLPHVGEEEHRMAISNINWPSANHVKPQPTRHQLPPASHVTNRVALPPVKPVSVPVPPQAKPTDSVTISASAQAQAEKLLAPISSGTPVSSLLDKAGVRRSSVTDLQPDTRSVPVALDLIHEDEEGEEVEEDEKGESAEKVEGAEKMESAEKSEGIEKAESAEKVERQHGNVLAAMLESLKQPPAQVSMPDVSKSFRDRSMNSR